MLADSSLLRRKLRSLALRVFRFVENNGNADFRTNGEEAAVASILRWHRNTPGLVILDVGANKGAYAETLLAHLAGTAATLHLFEPARSAFSALEEKFRRHPAVVLNNVGASDNSGRATIYYDEQGSGLTSLYKRNLSVYGMSMEQSETVETVRLDEYIEGAGISHIHFLKIDIEGHELAALRGLGKYLDGSFIDFLQFEYGGANLDSHTSLMELYALLEPAGFAVAKVQRRGLEVRSYLPWMDNFEYANYVAISQQLLPRLP